MKYLSSSKNPEIKHLRLLSQKSRERKKQGVFVIEGMRELEKATAGNYKITGLFIEEGFESEFQVLRTKLSEADHFLVSNSIFEQISFRSGSEKILAIAESKNHSLTEFELKKNALILVI